MPSAVDTIKPLVLACQSSKDCSRKSLELFFRQTKSLELCQAWQTRNWNSLRHDNEVECREACWEGAVLHHKTEGGCN